MKHTGLGLVLMSGLMFTACTDEGSELIPNGQACKYNNDCASKNCYEGKVCRAPNWGGSNTSNPDGTPTTSVTGKIENGKACTSNDQCASDNCYEGKVCRTPNWGGVMNLEIGSVCVSSDQCASKNCVKDVCNAEGDTVAKTKNGAACTANDQCASGNCVDGKICRGPHWNGSEKLENGEPCTTNSHCISNNCVGNICSAPGVTVKAPNGDPCKANTDCVSNYCYDSRYCTDKPSSGGSNGGSGSTVNTSAAVSKYCSALITECKRTYTYRTYEGCAETMALIRQSDPKCTAEWDAVYTCISNTSCYDLGTYDTPINNCKIGYVRDHVPNVCRQMAIAFDDCRKNNQ